MQSVPPVGRVAELGSLGRIATCEPNTQHHDEIMELIWNIISVFGLVSMLMLVLGIWTHLDMRKKQRQEESDAAKREKNHDAT